MLPSNKLAAATSVGAACYFVATNLLMFGSIVLLLIRPTMISTTTITTTTTTMKPSSPPKTLETNLTEALRNWNHTHDNNLVDFKLASYAWSRMDTVYREYVSQKVNRSRPKIMQLLEESRVSNDCKMAISHWLNDLANLEHWATLMWTSWGNFLSPGVFEGSFTDLGSYQGCFHVQDNEFIGETQYCTLDYQPIIPTRPRFHSIFKRILDVDEKTGKLTRGDYEVAAAANRKLAGSKIVSHTIAAGQYVLGASKTNKESKLTSSYLSKLPESSSSAADQYKLNTAAMVELARRAQYFYYAKLRIGTCWPTKCSKQDIQNVSRSAGSRAILQATEIYCVKNSQHRTIKLNRHQWVAGLVLGSITLIIILASFIDLLCSLLIFFEYKQLGEKILKCWQIEEYLYVCSLQRNFVRLFTIGGSPTTITPITTTTLINNDAKQRQRQRQQHEHEHDEEHEHEQQQQQQQPEAVPATKQLTCLNGIRIITMIWIIYGHTLLNNDYQAYTHAFRIIDEGLTNFFILPTLIANYGVDTFFVISGLLSSYIIFSLKVKFNGLLYTVARYFRLTPQLLIVILIFFLLPLAGDGPLYRQGTEIHAEKCYKNFWLNLLYLQTYIDRDNMCIIPTWWLSIEMTFHLISLIVIYTLIKRPKLGLLINFLIIFIMTLIGSIVHYTNGFAIQYLPSIPQKYEVEMEQTRWFYHRPYPHAPAYFIGLALGFIMAKNYIKTLNRLQLQLGWAISIFGFVASLWGTYYWNQGAPYTQLQATIYYNVCQVLWPISIAWTILICSLGYGGPLNVVLSARFFVPLGRITYMTYLSHIIIVYYYSASAQHTSEPSMLNLLYVCISNIVLSLCFGTILSLFFEAPMLNIQRIILARTYRRVEVSVIIPADTNGLSNQLIIESDAMTETKKAQERYSYRKTLIDNSYEDNSKN